jgi:allantoate deiminase
MALLLSYPRRHPSIHLLILSAYALFLLPILDGLELGGDGLYREILRDETVLRLKELGKVRFFMSLEYSVL